MMVYEGTAKNKVVVLPKDVHLEEGSRVQVRVCPAKEGLLEDLCKRRLVEAALVKEAPAVSWLAPERNRAPIWVQGKPLSETIIEGRQ